MCALSEEEKEQCVVDEVTRITNEVDIWRDTPVRYLGYANECGEALRALLPPAGVPASYALAIGYVLADTMDKAFKEWELSGRCETGPSGAMRAMRVATTAFDALSWQLLASVFVPGSVIHFTYSVMTFAVAHVTDVGGGDGTADMAFSTLPAATTAALNYLPTVVGLATIPFIVEPIDETIHKVHDMSIRPTLSASIDSFNRFEATVLTPDDENTDSTSDETETEARSDSFDPLSLFKGAGALAATVLFPPLAFGLSDVVDHLNF